MASQQDLQKALFADGAVPLAVLRLIGFEVQASLAAFFRWFSVLASLPKERQLAEVEPIASLWRHLGRLRADKPVLDPFLARALPWSTLSLLCTIRRPECFFGLVESTRIWKLCFLLGSGIAAYPLQVPEFTTCVAWLWPVMSDLWFSICMIVLFGASPGP